jgi:hypothetical protein
MPVIAAEVAAMLMRMSHRIANRLRCFPWEACGDRMLRLL